LINVLSKVKGLHVASRTSAFAFKGKNEDVRKIGQQLNVKTVLEGSVRKSGNRLRITAQLVNAGDGYQLWSETYNRQLEDVFAIQDEISQNIANALQVILSEKVKRAVEKARASDVEAYDYYLRGMQCFHQFRRKSLEQAQQMFLRAIEIDSGYARAYAGLADCYSLLYKYWNAPRENLERADEASKKALALDPELAEAHAARGVALSFNGAFDKAKKEFETAIKLNPKLFEAYYFYARACVSKGQLAEAARLFDHASQVSPEDYQAPLLGAGVLAGLGRRDEAQRAYRRGVQVAEKHLELHDDDARALVLGATGWCQLGDNKRALDWVRRALAVDANEAMTLYNAACAYALMDCSEEAIDCLEKAVANGYTHKEWIENDADFKSLHGQPRFQALLQSLARAQSESDKSKEKKKRTTGKKKTDSK
jgi:tetratricopeptide (TPR) repeat protein